MDVSVKFGNSQSPMYEFYKDKLISVEYNSAYNLIGENLEFGTMTVAVLFDVDYQEPLIDVDGAPLIDADGVPLVSRGSFDLRFLPQGTKATLYEINDIGEEKLKAVYFVDDVQRDEKSQYLINCVDIIGILENTPFTGRYYNNVPFSDVLHDLLPMSVNYQVSPYLQNIIIYGYASNGSVRETLGALMLAYGINIYNTGERLMFLPYGQAGNTKEIHDISIGWKVAYPHPPNAVQVTAHLWDTPLSEYGYEWKVIFDNTDSLIPANFNMVEVNEPYVGYRIEYVEGEEHLSTDFDRNPRLAEIGIGKIMVSSGIGKLYIKCPPRKDVVYEQMQDGIISAVDNIVKVNNNLFINPGNAPNLCKRLMDYYTNGVIYENDVIVTDERSGDLCSFTEPFTYPNGSSTSAVITSMSTVYSSNAKASCRFVAGIDWNINFPYKHYGKYFYHDTYLSHTIKLGQQLDQIRATGATQIGILLIGAGQAGYDGENGHTGEANYAREDMINRGGKGGKGGNPGHGGAVKFIHLDITNIKRIEVTTGYAGTVDGGEPYSPTVMYTYQTNNSSEIGQRYDTEGGDVYEYGTVNPLTGEYVARSGIRGFAGGDGGDSGKIYGVKVENKKWTFRYLEAKPGGQAKVPENSRLGYLPDGGYTGASGDWHTNAVIYYSDKVPYNENVRYTIGGPGGGGSTESVRGYSAFVDFLYGTVPDLSSRYFGVAYFIGGDGADAYENRPTPDLPGQGGNGGNGGGGGGAVGVPKKETFNGSSISIDTDIDVDSLITEYEYPRPVPDIPHLTDGRYRPGRGGNGSYGHPGRAGGFILFY